MSSTRVHGVARLISSGECGEYADGAAAGKPKMMISKINNFLMRIGRTLIIQTRAECHLDLVKTDYE
jgi:hypothetical protein